MGSFARSYYYISKLYDDTSVTYITMCLTSSAMKSMCITQRFMQFKRDIQPPFSCKCYCHIVHTLLRLPCKFKYFYFHKRVVNKYINGLIYNGCCTEHRHKAGRSFPTFKKKINSTLSTLNSSRRIRIRNESFLFYIVYRQVASF